MDYITNFLLLVFVYFLFFYKRWIKRNKKEFLLNTIMYVYVVMVLFVTVMPLTIPLGGTNNLFMETANFIPFRDVTLNYDGAFLEILLNIIMMIPFGFLYPILRRKGVIKTIILTFMFSLIIECTQLLSAWWGLISSRTFDVTDLITNTLGGLIGFLVYTIFRPVI
ncbi:MAG: VanZ family protein, partial [Thermoanaerobacterium sp.]|nr:VanZ family protein [Thermoanaerobacterium sp.]